MTAEHLLSPDIKRYATVQTLTSQVERYNQSKDPRVVFTSAYQIITGVILTKVNDQDKNFFDDPLWVARLVKRFAVYYTAATNAFDQENQHYLAEIWRDVFDLIEAGQLGRGWHPARVSVLEALIFPMIAHIRHDLPLALYDLAQEDESGDLQRHIHDYHRINDILYGCLEQIQHWISQRYNPHLGWLDDVVGGRYDETLTHRAIELARSKAWYDFTRLLAADDRQRATIKAALRDETRAEIELFYRPPHWGMRLFFSLLRRLTTFRTWPTRPLLLRKP